MKPVRGYEGFYTVDSDGKIYNARTGKELKPYNHTKGYLKVDLHDGSTGTGHGKQEFVHRIVATAFLKNPHGHRQVNHKNGNKHDNRAENLEWCSNDYNIGYYKAMHRMKQEAKQ